MIKFDLPKSLIAQKPAHPRDHARLLVYDRKTKQITDSNFFSLDKFLIPKTTIVLNNSKVENCRWLFDGDVEVFVLNKLDTRLIQAMVRPGKKFQLDDTVQLAKNISAKVVAIDEDGLRTLELSVPHDDKTLRKYEHIPLPPYIKQNDSLASEYQTVFADPLGSKAAPTAGLHFTKKLLADLKVKHRIYELTLHVGLGTFMAPSEEQIQNKHLHEEYFDLGDLKPGNLEAAKHITAVGTTVARTLETVAKTGYSSSSGWTSIFIQPGDKFHRVDSLITNFHLPGTSLLMLVEAFIGSASETKRIYDYAIKEKYRFYSFGDAMLIK